jgi:hypothetical protein
MYQMDQKDIENKNLLQLRRHHCQRSLHVRYTNYVRKRKKPRYLVECEVQSDLLSQPGSVSPVLQ